MHLENSNQRLFMFRRKEIMNSLWTFIFLREVDKICSKFSHYTTEIAIIGPFFNTFPMTRQIKLFMSTSSFDQIIFLVNCYLFISNKTQLHVDWQRLEISQCGIKFLTYSMRMIFSINQSKSKIHCISNISEKIPRKYLRDSMRISYDMSPFNSLQASSESDWHKA